MKLREGCGPEEIALLNAATAVLMVRVSSLNAENQEAAECDPPYTPKPHHFFGFLFDDFKRDVGHIVDLEGIYL